MRSTLTILFILLFFMGSRVPQAAAQAAPLAAAAPRADTVAAVQQLFKKHRTGGYIWTAIGAAFTARILIASAVDGFDNAGGTLVGIAVFGGVPGGIGIGKLSRFSEAKEDAVLADFQRYHRLPPYVQKRLKRKYFNS